jgi:DNA-binding NarL/FixJ family response regulator
MSELKAVRVVVADDHPIWRSGLRADLGSNFFVVGEAGDADEAIELIRSLSPTWSCATCTCRTGRAQGGAGLRRGRPHRDAHRQRAERDLLDAVSAGANGYLVKTPRPRSCATSCGGPPRASPCSRPRWRRWCWASSGAWPRPRAAIQPLSEREREVLQYVARGHTYREIGEQLFIAEKTVENHVRNILGKLHLNRRQELVRYALEHGIE